MLSFSRGISAASGEEFLQESRCVICQHAGCDIDTMVDARMVEDGEAGTRRTAFGVIGAINEALDASLQYRAGAHRARLDRDINRGANEAIIASGFCRGAEREHFRVRRGIAIGDGAVGRARDDTLVQHDDAADRDFSGAFSGRGLFEGHAHVNFVGGEIGTAVPGMVHGASE